MKKFKLLIISVLLTFLFTGCDSVVFTQVKMSELLNNEEKTLNGLISIEIPSCNDYEDSRLPSKGLVNMQTNIPLILPDAKYKECYTKKFKSYADFTVPIKLSKNNNKSDKYIGLGSDDANLLYVYVPEKIQMGIKNMQDKSLVKTNLKVQIHLINDLGKPSPKFTAFSLFLRDMPIEVMQLWLKEDSDPIITLSDVSVSKALNSPFVIVLLKTKE